MTSQFQPARPQSTTPINSNGVLRKWFVGLLGVVLVPSLAWSDGEPLSPEEFLAKKQFIDTHYGRVAYVEQGSGPVVLYIHGALLNGYQWRYQLHGLSDIRRGIAVDTLGMGYSQPKAGQALDIGSQADMIKTFLDALDIEQVDLVGNDSGGGIAQIFAAKNPERIRSLTLTNSEVVGFDDNNPTITQFRESVANGMLSASIKAALEEPKNAQASLATAFEFPNKLTPSIIHHYFYPLVESPEREKTMQDYLLAIGDEELRATEQQLKALPAPSMILWAKADTFFPSTLSYWLRDNLANVRRFNELENGKLFFPEEHPLWLNQQLRDFWLTQTK